MVIYFCYNFGLVFFRYVPMLPDTGNNLRLHVASWGKYLSLHVASWGKYLSLHVANWGKYLSLHVASHLKINICVQAVSCLDWLISIDHPYENSRHRAEMTLTTSPELDKCYEELILIFLPICPGQSWAI